MTVAHGHHVGVVNTVLGPVPAGEIGTVAIHESLLSVVPGAQYAFDISLDQSEIFDVLAGKLRAFKAAGGSTIVDVTGICLLYTSPSPRDS